MPKEAMIITQCESAPRLRITMAEIQEVKRLHILENLCYTPEETGAIFGKSPKWALEQVRTGKMLAVDEKAKESRGGGLLPSQGIRITALSVEAYRKEYQVKPDQWEE